LDRAGRSCSYAKLDELVSARADLLMERVKPGDVVAAVLPSGIEYAAWFCAAIAAGVRFLPLHTQVAGPEALAIATRAGAVAAILAPGVAAESALSHLAMDRRQRDKCPQCETTSDSRGQGEVVLGSSGTTGLPKLVLRNSQSLDADAGAVITAMGLTVADRVVFSTQLSHSYGVDVLVGVLTAGATLRVLSQFDAELLAQELEGGTTVLPAVPFVFEALARRARTRNIAVRVALSAGSPLSAGVGCKFFDAWGVHVGQVYGSTELGTVAVNVPDTAGFDPASIGRPLPGVSMRVLDVADPRRSVAVGEEGQLAVRAPSMLTEYLGADLSLHDGHLLTGDLAKMDDTGRVWITGRLKTMIDVGAFKVNPLEVESVLSTHPEVAECVVVPLAVSETLQRLRALVVLKDPAHPAAPEALRRFLRERLTPVKVPRVIDVVTSLPKSPTGKVLRTQAIGGRE
jgi:acyl-coenzyme A synthetase/AMP-(fatty) acid ligase